MRCTEDMKAVRAGDWCNTGRRRVNIYIDSEFERKLKDIRYNVQNI